jgi:pyridoxal phosphate enzyme (YggS family)
MIRQNDFTYLKDNLDAVRGRIEKCTSDRGTDDAVMLVVAAKYASCEEIDALRQLGVTELGENRVNTFLEHYEGASHEGINYHFIGSLQKNKVKYLCGKIKMLHSLDSLSLAEEIEKRYAKIDEVLDCLVEINIASEESKGGVLPSGLCDFLSALSAFEHINVRGFMTMAPADSTDEEFAAYFSEAVRLGSDAWTNVLKKEGKPFFSMGMSRSLEVAIRSGSSCVRIGYDVFGHK